MAEELRPFDKGLAEAKHNRRTSAAEMIAIVLSVLWFVVCIVLWRMPGFDWSGPALLTWLMGLLVPVALIWLAVSSARTANELKAEAEHLRLSLAELRRAQGQTVAQSGDGSLGRKIEDLTAAQLQVHAFIAKLSEERGVAQQAVAAVARQEPTHEGEPQASLSLGTPAEALDDPVTVDEFVRALNFPENENDAAGFQTLRKSLRDPWTQRLVRASQDVLTLLSQDGIYMDDLRPDRARPEVWRAFARGDRGRAIAGLGGVHDRSGLALASGRMRQDPVFRDATHHFLRSFDQTFMEFERRATDEDIINLADTRTARAFMLLGRVTGTFD